MTGIGTAFDRMLPIAGQTNRTARAVLCMALGLCMLGLAGCGTTVMRPIVTKHGYVPEEDKLDALEAGVTSKAVAEATLGTPSSIATFDPNTWYYISSTQERFAFLEKETKDRKVVAVSFDDTGILENVETYDISDGRIVRYSGGKTRTRGKELTFLEQLFGSVGSGLPGGGALGGQGPGPGGPGGPGPGRF